jgi:uncharacterized membrane protein YbhN (UPF0104 family)
MDHGHHDEEMPKLRVTRRTVGAWRHLVVLRAGVPVLRAAAVRRAGGHVGAASRQGNPWWLALAFLFTVLSFVGYVVLLPGGLRARGQPHRLSARATRSRWAGLAAPSCSPRAAPAGSR